MGSLFGYLNHVHRLYIAKSLKRHLVNNWSLFWINTAPTSQALVPIFTQSLQSKKQMSHLRVEAPSYESLDVTFLHVELY